MRPVVAVTPGRSCGGRVRGNVLFPVAPTQRRVIVLIRRPRPLASRSAPPGASRRTAAGWRPRGASGPEVLRRRPGRSGVVVLGHRGQDGAGLPRGQSRWWPLVVPRHRRGTRPGHRPPAWRRCGSVRRCHDLCWLPDGSGLVVGGDAGANALDLQKKGDLDWRPRPLPSPRRSRTRCATSRRCGGSSTGCRASTRSGWSAARPCSPPVRSRRTPSSRRSTWPSP